MKHLAVIPARANSKRIPKKNIRDFHGKPIISWVVEKAINSSHFSMVIVSTDSQEIARVVNKAGAETPFIRPANISDDFSSVFEVVKHSIKFLNAKNKYFDLVTLIYPTSPLLNMNDVRRGTEAIDKYDFAMSVSKYAYPIQRALRLNKKEQTMTMIFEENFKVRSQDLDPTFHDAGQFVVGKQTAWLEKNPLTNGRTVPIIIPASRVQDIDTEDDWIEAEKKFTLNYE